MKIQSTLPEQPFFVHIASLLNLIIIIVLVTMGSTRIGVNRGIEIELPKTQYVLALTSQTATITVSGGNDPAFYLNNERVPGLSHLESALDKLKSDMELKQSQSQILVVLRLDGSVNRALEQQLIEMVLSRGMNCALAGDAA